MKQMEDAGMEFLLDAVDRFPIREEFADNVDQPDPVPLALLSPVRGSQGGDDGHGAASGCGQRVGDSAGDAAKCGERRRREASPTASAQSTDRVNPEAR